MKLFDRSNAAPWCPAMLPTILLSLIINSPKWAVNPFLNRLHGTTLFLETSSMIFVRFPSNTVRMWEFGQTKPTKSIQTEPSWCGFNPFEKFWSNCIISPEIKTRNVSNHHRFNRFVRFLLGFIPCVSIHIQLGGFWAHTITKRAQKKKNSPKVAPKLWKNCYPDEFWAFKSSPSFWFPISPNPCCVFFSTGHQFVGMAALSPQTKSKWLEIPGGFGCFSYWKVRAFQPTLLFHWTAKNWVRKILLCE